MRKQITYLGDYTYRLVSREPTSAIFCQGGCGKPATFELWHSSAWGFEPTHEARKYDGAYCEEDGLRAMTDAAAEVSRMWQT